MDLLDEIIEIAIDTQQSLPVLLRKCLLLAYQLKNDRLKSWANQELNGYGPSQDLPDYRIMHLGSYANFSGPFGASLRNWPIPPSMLDESHRDYARILRLRQAISCYEATNISDDAPMTYMWPGDLSLYYQDRFVDGYALVSAWQSVPASAIRGMVDTIRNRTLNMTLEIKTDIGALNGGGDMTRTVADKVSQSVTHNIFNGPAYFGADKSQFNIVTTGDQTAISQGDRDALDNKLLQSGLSEPDIAQLTDAMQADGKNIGTKVNSWMAKVAPKIVVAGATVTAKIAQSLLTDLLRQYLGMQ